MSMLRAFTAGLCLSLGAIVHAAMPALPQNGWASFDVSSVPAAANWCCFNMRKEQLACDLDKSNQGFASTSGDASTSLADQATRRTSMVRVFVQMKQGRVNSLRPVGLSCPVSSSKPVQHLGPVDDSMSLAWLQAQANKPELTDAALAAISAHDSNQADQILRGFTAKEIELRVRKAALFWAGQMRGSAGFDMADSALADASNAFRAHALFVIAQSQDVRRLQRLSLAGQRDESAHVRGQAWFWLAQARGLDQAAVSLLIQQAVRSDPKKSVQEHAIFALSQLSDGGASTALIALLNDRKLAKSLRERALFWLAQSEDLQAQQYLERALSN
jgi:hypothetical protein